MLRQVAMMHIFFAGYCCALEGLPYWCMASYIFYGIAAIFAGVGALALASFVMVTAMSQGAIHEIGATLLLLCSIVSWAAACIVVLLTKIVAALRREE